MTLVGLALAVTFAVAGWPLPVFLGVLGAVIVYAWVACTLGDMEGRHAVDEDDWVASVINEMERDLANGEENAAATRPAPDEPAAAPRPRGVLGRIAEMAPRDRLE